MSMTECFPEDLPTVDMPSPFAAPLASGAPFPTAYLQSPYGRPERTAIELTIEAMRNVLAVPKDGHNQAQGFNFRGIDGVLNACGPALRKAGVLPVPFLTKIERSTVEVGARRTPMDSVYIEVVYLFYGPGADAVGVKVPGASMDSGDKGVTKAMSVAFRTALIQLFALPTQEPDPDSTVYERAPALEPQAMAVRAAALAASTVEALRAIYEEARAVPGLGAIEVPDADGRVVTLAALITARGEHLAAETAAADRGATNRGAPSPDPADNSDLDPNTRLASNGQLQQIGVLLGEGGVTKRESRLLAVSELAGRALTSSAELTMVEARDIIKQLRAAVDAGNADALLYELLENPKVTAGAAS